MSRNNQALRHLSITLAGLTYAGAVLYGDIMFIQVMHTAFPTGVMGTLAIAGAIMTAVSAITLPIALHWWFAPGLQFVWGIIFWSVDLVALSLNAMLAYAVATGNADPWLMQWQQLSPATPLLATLGWGLAFLLDPSQKLRHAQAELEADLTDIHAQQLRQAARGGDVASTITRAAQSAAASTAAALTGAPISSQQVAQPPALGAPPAGKAAAAGAGDLAREPVNGNTPATAFSAEHAGPGNGSHPKAAPARRARG